MNKTLFTTLTILAVLALAAVIFLAWSVYARTNSIGYSMMGGWNNDNAYGPNMMNGRGPSMMGGYDYTSADLPTLTVDQVKTAAEKYLANLDNSDFEIAEIMVFDNNGYVIVKEASTGIGAFELLVDPVSQVAYPEHGPNMMWNLKYSGLTHEYMMGNGGMMGGYGNMMQGWDNTTPLNVTSEMTVTSEQAEEYAQQ